MLTRSIDRNMIAFAAMTSQGLSRDQARIVVRTGQQCLDAEMLTLADGSGVYSKLTKAELPAN